MSAPVIIGGILVAALIVGVLVAPVGPTRLTGGVVIAIAISAIVLPPLVVGVEAAMLLALFAMDAVRSAPRPTVRITLPPMLSRGVPASYTAHVDRPGNGTRIWLRQARIPDLDLDPFEGWFRIEARVIAHRRGHHVLPPVGLRVVGPFRLASWRRTAEATNEVAVYPDLPAARRLALAVRTNKFRDPGRITRGPLGLGTEFESIREYLPDDDVRQVNWRATARTGHPMTNQFRTEQDRDLVFLLDCGRLMTAPLGDRTRLDAAVDALAATAMVSDVVGDRCGVVAFDREVRRSVRPTRAGADRVIRAVYDLEPSRADSAFEVAFRSLGTGKRAFVLVFTDLLDLAAARYLLDAIPVLVRRHAVVVASVVDPDVARVVSEPGEDRDAPYLSAVALDLLEERRRVVALLEHAGAGVLEATGDDFSAACVSAYLRAKQRARV